MSIRHPFETLLLGWAIHGSGITNARSGFGAIRALVRSETSLLHHPLPTVSEYLYQLTCQWPVVGNN